MPKVSGKIINSVVKGQTRVVAIDVDAERDFEFVTGETVMIADPRSVADAFYALENMRAGRNTGRTSRMCRDAIIYAMNRRRVLLVFPTDSVARAHRDLTKHVAEELRVPHVMNLLKFRSLRELADPRVMASLASHVVLRDHSCDDYRSSGRRKPS